VKLPICHECWEQIADSDLEWGEGISAKKQHAQIEEAKNKILEEAMRGAAEEVAEKVVMELKRRLRRIP